MLKKICFLNLLLVLLVLNSCTKKVSDEDTSGLTKGIQVHLVKPIRTNMTEYVNLNAVTAFQNQEIIRSTFAGYIVKVYHNPGDHINKGDILFLVRTKESSASDTVDIDYGGGEFTGLVKIFSRTGGVLTELDFQNGNYISDGDKLGIIVEPGSLKIMLNVPFKYSAAAVRAGSYTVLVPDGKIIHANLVKKIPSINPESQTQTFILQPSPAAELPANLNVIVLIPVKTAPDVIALPKSAVISNEILTSFWVMKAVNDSLAVKLPVQKGIESDSLVQILSPTLNLSDRFIGDGAYGLNDSVKISVNGQY